MTTPTPIASPVLVSVVVPLADARGDALEHLETWTHGQLVDRSQFQLVIASDGADEAEEQLVRGALSRHDVLVRRENASEMELWVEAARRATGEILLITENHVDAHPHCVGEVIEHFKNHPRSVAVFLRSQHLNPTDIARMEAAHHGRTMPLWGERHTARVTLRGFAIRRRVYDEIGGLREDLDLFAPDELGARLYASGYSIEPLSSAVIAHVNTALIDKVHFHVRRFTRGENQYRSEADPAFFEEAFGHVRGWENRHLYDRERSSRLAVGLWRMLSSTDVGGGWGARWDLFREWVGSAVRSSLGARGPWLWARVRASWWREWARWPILPMAMRSMAFDAGWNAVVDETRWEPVLEGTSFAPAITTGTSLPIDEIPAGARMGFHGVESTGIPFRWSLPTALFRLSLDDADHIVRLQLRPHRGPDASYLIGALWNGKVLARDQVRLNESELTVRLPREVIEEHAIGELVVVTRPIKGTLDGRRLGLAIEGISVERESAVIRFPQSTRVRVAA
jgi:hypothetical protein